MVKGKSFYCRYEERHLEESRAEREGSRLNTASRLDLAMREARYGRWRRGRRCWNWEGDRENRADIAGL